MHEVFFYAGGIVPIVWLNELTDKSYTGLMYGVPWCVLCPGFMEAEGAFSWCYSLPRLESVWLDCG